MDDQQKRREDFSENFVNPLMKQIDDFFQQKPVRSMLDSIDSFFQQASIMPVIPIDLYETQSHIVIKANLPGVNREQITIEPMYDSIKISVIGSEIDEEVNETKNYYRKERRLQKMERIVSLPFSIEDEKTTASFHSGILTIKTPKQTTKKRTIQIEE